MNGHNGNHSNTNDGAADAIQEEISAGEIIEAETIGDTGVVAGEIASPAGTTFGVVASKKDEVGHAPASIAKSASVVSAAVMGSRILGLVRDQVFAAKFGAGFLYDAFVVGFRIPNLLRDLFAEGALSAAFVKTFTDYQVKRSEEEAWRLASLVMNALVVVLSVITILGVIFSPQIIQLTTENFPPEVARLATTLTRIMFPFILLVALAAVAMGVLNTKGKFGIPASASTFFNIGSIVGGLALAYWLSGGGWETPKAIGELPAWRAERAIIGMAIGTLIGGAIQFAIQVPSLIRVGFRFHLRVNFADPGVRQVMRLMAPAIIGTAAVQVNVLVNTYFATGIAAAPSWLSYAFRLMQFPIGIFGVAIGTATLPAISRYAASSDIPKFRSTLSNSLSLVFLMTIPSACGLIVLGKPIIALIYEYGRFTSVSTEMTAWALAGYSVGLAGYAAIKVLSPAFYALDDARTPMIISLVSIAVNGVAAYLFRMVFSQIGVTEATPGGLGHAGLALSTSCVALINFFALMIFMRRKIKRLEGRKIMSSFARIVAASAALSVFSYGAYRWMAGALGEEGLAVRLAVTFVPIAIGSVVFLGVARALKIEELDQALNAVLGRFTSRARR